MNYLNIAEETAAATIWFFSVLFNVAKCKMNIVAVAGKRNRRNKRKRLVTINCNKFTTCCNAIQNGKSICCMLTYDCIECKYALEYIKNKKYLCVVFLFVLFVIFVYLVSYLGTTYTYIHSNTYLFMQNWLMARACTCTHYFSVLSSNQKNRKRKTSIDRRAGG